VLAQTLCYKSTWRGADFVNSLPKVTSFVGRDLQERFSCSRALRKQYLPIYPSAVHPDNGLQLFLQNNAELPKKSFVNTEHAYNVNCGLLRPFHQDEYCLSDESYTTLVQYMGLPLPSPMHPTLPVLNTPPVGTGMAAPLRDTRTPTRSRREQIPLLPPPNRVHAVPQPWQEEPSSKGHGSLSALLVLGSITVVAWIGYKMFFGRA
jgi:hypothetical protein